MKSRILPVAVALALIVGGSATAGSLITSAQIKDHTIQARDLSPTTLRALRGRHGPQGPPGFAQTSYIDGTPGALCPDGGANGCQVGSSRVSCPDGYVFLSGGYIIDNSINAAVTYAAVNPDGSYGAVAINYDTQPGATITARALCGQAPSRRAANRTAPGVSPMRSLVAKARAQLKAR